MQHRQEHQPQNRAKKCGADFSTPQENFFAMEYESLRREMDYLIDEIRKFEKWALALSGAFWAWTMTHLESFQSEHYLLLPAFHFILIVFSCYRARELRSLLIKMSEYIIKIEGWYGVPDNLGWEREYQNLLKRGSLRFGTTGWFWTLMVLISLIIDIALGINILSISRSPLEP
tara:strand:- start:258 stop:779 length:522 start_codon:yes stop_codon:yes gene_type:complete